MRRYAWLVIVILIKLSVSFIGMVEIREALAQEIPERREVRKIYWGDIGTRQIQRANPDGSNIETVVTDARPWDLALDIAAGKIYWVSLFDNRVRRANLDGSNVEDLVTERGGEGIDLDLAAGKIYWAGGGQIQRANLDGSEIESLVTGLSKPDSMALDLINGKVYWTDSIDGTIQRANLDGSNVEVLITGLSVPQGLNLDLVEGKMYWSNWPPIDKIQRANLDGTNIEDIAPGLGGLEGIALDFNTGKMYWTDFSVDKIQRANFDGSNIEDIVTTGLSHPISIIFETVPIPLTFTPSTIADQTFTVGTAVSLTLPTATGGTAPYTYSVSALPAGLDFDATTQQLSGTPTTVVNSHPVTYTVTDANGSTTSLDFAITVQDTPPATNLYMYWADAHTRKIQRANLDGTNIQDIITGLIHPLYLKLDVTGGKIYWTGWVTGRIRSANLDGSDLQDLVVKTGSGNPHSIALDVADGKMYWTEWTLGKIQRANLDGSNIEDIVTTGLIHPDDIVLDVANSKMYWTDTGTDKIQRANLDGSNIEDIVTTGLSAPDAITLDLVGRKVYWTDVDTDKIQRANLDGSNIEDIVTTGLDRPAGITVDPAGGKIYWTDWGPGKIQRANLDGSNIEDIVTTGLDAPIGIVLGIPQSVTGFRFSPNIIADRTFTVGTYASLNLPIAVGGTAPYIYTLTPQPPAGLLFDAINRSISGTPIAPMPATSYTYTATDAAAETASLTFTIEVTGADNLDVNSDGQVTVIDLAIVALFYGTQASVGVNLPADVNADGVVNLLDLTAVAQAIDAAGGVNGLSLQELEAALLAGEIAVVAGAPMGFGTLQHVLSPHIVSGNVAAALADVKHFATGDVRLGKALETVLSELLHLLAELTAIPKTTALLPNYPNPFNPETWIPYHLSKDAEVIVAIYDMRGVSVRELVLGHQSAGVYESRGRAAYWDGRNSSGEPVASGVYFYTLTAGDFTATRKLLIAK